MLVNVATIVEKVSCSSSLRGATMKASIPRPYSFLFHPLCYWLDKLLSWLVSILLPVKIVARYAPKIEKETLKMKASLQKSMDRVSNSTGHCKKWSAMYGTGVPIVECIMKVPRRQEVLVEWGIMDEMETTRPDNDGFVDILFKFPASLLPEEKKAEILTKNDRSSQSGCIKMESFNLEDIPAEVPILIWFHGGGLTIGSFNDPEGVEAIVDIVEKAGTFGKAKSGVKHPAAVLASVQYRLAPEHPFPAAPIDGLSVANHILESNPLRKVHIGGASAGGYIAITAALECYRRYPGRVNSLFAVVPMLGPSTDSMSYHLESKASLHVPVEFLRWSWKAYLELDDGEDDFVPDVDNTNSLKEILGRGSTRNAWDQCKWKKGKARRLIEPSVDLPLDLEKENAPRIVIVTNMADPLHDDGVDFANALKQAGASVTHVDCFGSHFIGYTLDTSSKAKATTVWSEAVFQST